MRVKLSGAFGCSGPLCDRGADFRGLQFGVGFGVTSRLGELPRGLLRRFRAASGTGWKSSMFINSVVLSLSPYLGELLGCRMAQSEDSTKQVSHELEAPEPRKNSTTRFTHNVGKQGSSSEIQEVTRPVLGNSRRGCLDSIFQQSLKEPAPVQLVRKQCYSSQKDTSCLHIPVSIALVLSTRHRSGRQDGLRRDTSRDKEPLPTSVQEKLPVAGGPKSGLHI